MEWGGNTPKTVDLFSSKEKSEAHTGSGEDLDEVLSRKLSMDVKALGDWEHVAG